MERNGKATIISHSCVFGRREIPVCWFRTSKPQPYAQYDRAVTLP